jgi:hypothetical protein
MKSGSGSSKYYSRSLITNNKNIMRVVINPVETAWTQDFQFDSELLRILKIIDTNYAFNLASKLYMNIPQNIDTYLSLDYQLGVNMATTKNSNLLLLLKIARETLTGAIQSRTLYTDTAELIIKNTILETRIADILSGKNELSAMGDTCGEFVITKTFKLAAVYSYYITLYGLPAFGVGFDIAKLTLLVDILRRYGIDPYR